MRIEPGQILRHYRIVEKIGAGGMGEVYRAEDLELGREVALKVLPAATSADPDRLERFRREARALATLDHPGIVTIHSVEEAGGIHFLTMTLVEGKTLDQLIPAGGLSLDLLCDLGTALADALAAAHDKGVIHRDLKPHNIMVTGSGRLQVLDFGLAKLTEPLAAGDDEATRALDLTQKGTILGTPAYMAPEQIEGKPSDHRTDLFLLGILLHEMATGRRPFQGQSTAAVMAAVLKDTPLAAAAIRTGLPLSLSAIISHCLAKEPDNRYASAREVHRDLTACQNEVRSGAPAAAAASGAEAPGASHRIPVRAWGLTIAAVAALAIIILAGVRWSGVRELPTLALPPTPVDQSIAVLPFVNVGADPANEYFSDGLSEELLNSLAQLKGLKVAARTSSFAFKNQQIDLRSVAERLGVNTVLEGSVRRQGERVRITAQLISAADGYQLWSESYERQLDDVFAIQADIARRVADALRVRLLDSDTRRLDTPGTQSTAAYDLYLLGLQRMASFTVDSVLEAAELFRQATELDPGFAKAHAGISSSYLLGYETSGIHRAELFRVAEPAMQKAMTLDPGLSEAHAAQGGILAARGNAEAAKAAFRRALELNPGNTLAGHLYAAFLWSRWEIEEALEVYDQALRIDPFDATLHGLRGWALQSAGRLEEALSAMARARAIDEKNPIGYYLAGLLCLDSLADLVQAETWFQRSAEVDPEDPELIAWLAHVYLTLDDLSLAEQMAQRALEMNPLNAFVLSTRALVHVRRGEDQAALSLARRGLEPDIVQRFAGQLVFLRLLTAEMVQQGRIRAAVQAYEAAYPTIGRVADLFSAPINLAFETGELVRAAVDLAYLKRASGDASGAQALIGLVRQALQRQPRIQSLRLYGPGTALAEMAIIEGRKEDALSALEEVVDTGWLVNWHWEIESNPIFDTIRDEPVYQRIIAKLEAETRRQHQMWQQKARP